jgi:hypothetical protein
VPNCVLSEFLRKLQLIIFCGKINYKMGCTNMSRTKFQYFAPTPRKEKLQPENFDKYTSSHSNNRRSFNVLITGANYVSLKAYRFRCMNIMVTFQTLFAGTEFGLFTECFLTNHKHKCTRSCLHGKGTNL